jgi:GTPase SAR1 family protein
MIINFNEFINEEYKTIMGIDDLADLISRMGYDKDVILQMFQETFRKSGDEGIKKEFEELTKGIKLENIIRGKYKIIYQ